MNLLIVLLSLTVIPCVLSCNCTQFSDYKTLQEQFCESDIVIGISVFDHDSHTNHNADRKYTVQVTDVFKGSPVNVARHFNLLSTIHVYTYATEETCGITLHKGMHYVVGGKIEDGKNWISICYLNYPGYGLPCSPELFTRGCQSCKIKRCGSGFCTARQNECIYRPDKSKQRYDDACVPNGAGCEWRECEPMQILSTLKVVQHTTKRPRSVQNGQPHLFHVPHSAEPFRPPAFAPNFFVDIPPYTTRSPIPPAMDFGHHALAPNFFVNFPPPTTRAPPRKHPLFIQTPARPRGIPFWLEPNHWDH